MIEIRHIETLKLAQTRQIVVRLGVRGVALQRGVVLVACRVVNCKTEKDLVVNVNMLAKGLIWVQRLYLAFNKSHGSGGGSSSEVCVDI
jgi:hypothetical protein